MKSSSMSVRLPCPATAPPPSVPPSSPSPSLTPRSRAASTTNPIPSLCPARTCCPAMTAVGAQGCRTCNTVPTSVPPRAPAEAAATMQCSPCVSDRAERPDRSRALRTANTTLPARASAELIPTPWRNARLHGVVPGYQDPDGPQAEASPTPQ